jgi:pimeloyl-ACP methyl ester carboxylesterase
MPHVTVGASPPVLWPAPLPGRPTVIHGDADLVLPLDTIGKQLSGLINDLQLVVIEGGPHAILWTHGPSRSTQPCSTSCAAERRFLAPTPPPFRL